jgi:hypothetical protein
MLETIYEAYHSSKTRMLTSSATSNHPRRMMTRLDVVIYQFDLQTGGFSKFLHLYPQCNRDRAVDTVTIPWAVYRNT